MILEYSEKEDGPVMALVFIKRKDGRGMACVGGFVQLGEFELGGKGIGGWEGGREGQYFRSLSFVYALTGKNNAASLLSILSKLFH